MISEYDKMMFPGIEKLVLYTMALPFVIAFTVITGLYLWRKYVDNDHTRRKNK